MRTALAMLGVTALAVVIARPYEPYTWGHRLTAACEWLPMPSQQLFGGEYMRGADRDALAACWKRHGAHAVGPLPVLKVIARRWPTQAELAAWDGENR